MKHKTKKFIIHPTTTVFLIILSLSGAGYEGAVTLFCALMHELGHYLAARLCKESPDRIIIYPFGADMVFSSGLRSYKKDIFIAFCGPAVNIILIPIGIRLGFGGFFAACNLSLAFMNLLPIRGLDGGVILEGLLLGIFAPNTAKNILLFSTFSVLFFAYMVSVYLLFSPSGDPSLFVIVCALFASSFLKSDTVIKPRIREDKREF